MKNDERDAVDLVDLLRLGRLAEAWIAPPGLRELRELIRHRAKLVALRSSLKCGVHTVIAKIATRHRSKGGQKGSRTLRTFMYVG